MNLVQRTCAGLLALLLVVGALPAQAQMEDGELPKIDFAVNVAQHAQYISLENADDPVAGFQRVRAGLNASVQFSENVSALVMLEQEPNDFGFGTVTPAVDFVIMDLALTDQLTLRTGTPVTGLMNFRGYSDGPAVQGNPLIGNSPADMITAGQGVKLIGSFETVGFDLTVNRGFAGDLTQAGGGATGLNIIGKVRYTGSDLFKVGAGLATATGQDALVFARGDGDNYDLNDAAIDANGNPSGTRLVHAQMPNETIFHADAKLMAAGADVDLWGGYATQGDFATYGGDDFSALFGGLGLKYDLTEDFYGAGRLTYIGDQSDGTDDLDETSITRIQIGIGYEVYDNALFKVEYVNQSETALSTNPQNPQGTALSGIGQNWQGVTTELSFNF